MVVYIALVLTFLFLALGLAWAIASLVNRPGGPWDLVRRARARVKRSRVKRTVTGRLRDYVGDPSEGRVTRRLRTYVGKKRG